jgi:ABC-type xylose transport system permease subunit
MWVFYIYFGSMWAILHYGTKAVKEHITYPRTGFVEYRKRDRVGPTILAVVAAPASLTLIMLAVRRHWDLTTGASLVGLLSAASYAYHFAREVRWKWAVASAMALGSILIAILPGDLIGSLNGLSWLALCLPSFMLWGPLLLISGGISFWLYLRHTRPPAPEGE